MPYLLRIVVAFVFLAAGGVAGAAVSTIEAAVPPPDKPRLALVIGNSQYQSINALRNPVADADAIARTLSHLGFKVTLAHDLARFEMNTALAAFASAVKPGDEVVVYYAGHGVEAGGNNYLLPVDIPPLEPGQEALLDSEGVALQKILDMIGARRPHVSLVILDACRDNPFEVASRTAGRGGAVGATRGLARVDPPVGTFVLYAALPGQVALDAIGPDDPSPNGVFTRHLLSVLPEEGLEIRPMALKLRERVMEATLANGAPQITHYDDKLLSNYFLKPAGIPKIRETSAEAALCAALLDPDATPDRALALDPAPARAACTQAFAADPADPKLRGFLAMLAEREAARTALAAASSGPAETYLAAYPEGRFRGQVERRRLALPTPSADLPGPAPSPPAGLPPLEGEALAMALQGELARVGCLSGTADGAWGEKSRDALRRFGLQAGVETGAAEPNVALLDALRARRDRVCPLVCGPREEAKGGVCVARTCPAGQALSSAGECFVPQARVEPKATPRIVPKRTEPRVVAPKRVTPKTAAPKRVTPKVAAPKPTPPRKTVVKRTPPRKTQTVRKAPASGGNCFTFNGERVCE